MDWLGRIRFLAVFFIGTLLWLVLSSGFASWQGHLGGLLAGGLAGLGLAFAPRARRATWQAAALGGVTLVFVVLLVAKCLRLTGGAP